MSDLEFIENEIENVEADIRLYMDSRKKVESARPLLNKKIKLLNERKKHLKSIRKIINDYIINHVMGE